MRAIRLFEEHEKSILQTIKAADLYALHLLAIDRDEQPDRRLIREIITENKVSSLTVLGVGYKKSDKQQLEESGKLRSIGNLILLAAYTALEDYLINKFKEYVRLDLKGQKSEMVLDHLPYGGLSHIKELYKNILDIHLQKFEMNKDDKSFLDDKSPFYRKQTWDGIELIRQARNDIAHKGKTDKYVINMLSHAWDPFEFIRRWVSLFDAHFDLLIYEGRPTARIEEYKKRVPGLRKQRGRKS